MTPSAESWHAWNPGADKPAGRFHYVMPNRFGEGWYCPRCQHVLKRRSDLHGLGRTSKLYPQPQKRSRTQYPYQLMAEIELQDQHLREMRQA